MGTGDLHTGLWCGDLREGDHSENLCVEGRIILKWISFTKWNEETDWVDLAQDRGRYCALVKVFMNIWVP
jgi:hypothetical protein